jgi:hypothetical protein
MTLDISRAANLPPIVVPLFAAAELHLDDVHQERFSTGLLDLVNAQNNITANLKTS